MPPKKKTKEEATEAFHARCEKQPNGCWIWTATRTTGGYGVMWWSNQKLEKAHRISWFLSHGEWPKHTLDHLCRMTSCVNPKHLEDVPHRINVLRGVGWAGLHARKTHCPQGHEFDKIYSGKRYCSTCTNEYQNRRYHALLDAN